EHWCPTGGSSPPRVWASPAATTPIGGRGGTVPWRRGTLGRAIPVADQSNAYARRDCRIAGDRCNQRGSCCNCSVRPLSDSPNRERRYDELIITLRVDTGVFETHAVAS